MKELLKITAFVVAFCTAGCLAATAADRTMPREGWYFFSPRDLRDIRVSATTTEWGAGIVKDLNYTVSKRRRYPLDVPTEEGGYKHHYFCPVHDTEFKFDYENPREHYCELCGRYYSGEKKYDMAWIDAMHKINASYLSACTYLYIITADKKYAYYISDMLADYAAKYPGYKEHAVYKEQFDISAGRMFSQSLDESVWMADATRAYAVAQAVIPKKVQAAIEENLFRPCAEMLKRRQKTNNWQAWHNCGIASLGVALRDDALIGWALDTPKYGFRAILDANLLADGWWAEGSVGYHFYPLRAMVLTAEAARCRGIDLYDKKLYTMFATPVRGAYANLVFVAHNDGWYGASLKGNAKLYEIAYKRFGDDPLFASVLDLCYASSPRRGAETLLNPREVGPDPQPLEQRSCLFSEVGYAVLRSEKYTMIMKYGPHGGSHGHPDKLSVTLHDGTREVLPDMATPAYGVPDFKAWYKRTLSHNTVTVDSRDQSPATGRLVAFEETPSGGRVEAVCTEAYPGVEMRRRVELDGREVKDLFTCTSDSVHRYDYVLLLTDYPELASAGKDAVLEGSEVYRNIRDVKSFPCRGRFTLKLPSGEAEITIDGPAEVFIGTAKGAAFGKADNNTVARSVSHPLVVRTSGKNMKIETIWKLK